MEPRKPTVITSGYNPDLTRLLTPVKITLDLLTGASTAELAGLKDDASLEDIIEKINAIIARLNASGRVK